MKRFAEAVDTALGPADTWQPLTLDNGWSGNAFVKKYQDGTVALAGSIGSPSTDPTNKGTFATLPAQYRPAVTQRLSMNDQCTTDRFTGNYLARPRPARYQHQWHYDRDEPRLQSYQCPLLPRRHPVRARCSALPETGRQPARLRGLVTTNPRRRANEHVRERAGLPAYRRST